MRHVLIPLTFALMISPLTVAAAPGNQDHTQDFDLPSQTEIEEMIDRLPDFNAIIDDVIKLTENDRLKKRMEHSGEVFADKLERSGALEPDENGVPDIKLALKVIASTLSDDEVKSGLLDTLSEMQDILDKHIPDDTNTDYTD